MSKCKNYSFVGKCLAEFWLKGYYWEQKSRLALCEMSYVDQTTLNVCWIGEKNDKVSKYE